MIEENFRSADLFVLHIDKGNGPRAIIEGNGSRATIEGNWSRAIIEVRWQKKKSDGGRNMVGE